MFLGFARVPNPQANIKTSNTNIGNFITLYLNIRGLRNKTEELELIVDRFQTETNSTVHIIALTETWSHENKIASINLMGYEHFASVRRQGRGGGCSFFAHSSIEANLVYENE